jgi:hypothetical protein
VRKVPKSGLNSAEALEGRIEELERKLERLRAMYETFFMGVERAPPNVPRREMNRLIVETQQVAIANAALRFRFQSILQRWVLYTSYWNRTMREMEAGTYRRDLARAQRHLAGKGGGISEQEALALGIPASRVKAFVGRQQKGQGGRPGSAGGADGTRPNAAPPLPGISDDELTAVYSRLVEAHRRMGDAAAPTLDKIRSKLAAQLPRVMEEKKCSRVSLEVAVEDGKVRLRAWPVK